MIKRLLRSWGLVAMIWLAVLPASANPKGGTVAQGTAAFNNSGSQLTVHTSDRAFINWQSFNIAPGQTTTFVQPSASSVVWNRINDPSPSQILGTLNANGYVILQNASGIFVGGQAVINTHGLMMTTAPIPMPDLSSSGPWAFSAPPPTAKIINYGQINVGKGGAAFLIAHDIENHGELSAGPGGNLGLYAGKTVLVSQRPDGRGISAAVTLPEGSVDNSGNLIADGGAIALRAQVVNQGGLVQANSVRHNAGTIELIASESVNLGANSVISAKGDTQGASRGGTVTIKSEDGFSDAPTSVINIAGGVNGGNGGQVEISARRMNAIQSIITGEAASGYLGGVLSIDPLNITLDASGSPAPADGTVLSTTDPDLALTINPGSFSKTLSQINLQAINDITIATPWTLADPGTAATLTLSAGNNIILNNGASIKAGNNWNISIVAGSDAASLAEPINGLNRLRGIYLDGNSFIQTQNLQPHNGNINLWAANEVILNPGPANPALSTGDVGSGRTWNGIRTLNIGNITVTAVSGDVNTGGNYNGFSFAQNSAPFYKVNAANLGGISTAAGGNVTINAGGNVTSFIPKESDYLNAQYDGGSGAFGGGNVNITAGGNVFGHYVLADGDGLIKANGDVGTPLTENGGFALSLVKGNWDVEAPNGNIYLQDVRNPNGIFNNRSSGGYAGYHYFDYDPAASLTLHAGNSVEITGDDAPHTTISGNIVTLPTLFPPTLKVTADAGNFILDTSVILFPSLPALNIPSLYGDLNITTKGDFAGRPGADGISPSLEMSDSGDGHWIDSSSFGTGDHALSPPEINNRNPVAISVSGSIRDVNIYTTKETKIKVGGDMINASFTGENLHPFIDNLHPGDTTSIDVTGSILNSPLYAFVKLGSGIISANPLQPRAWDSVFALAIDPTAATALANIDVNSLPVGQTLAYYLKLRNYLLFPSDLGSSDTYGANPGFQYVSSTVQLGFKGNMAAALANGTMTDKQLNALEAGHFTVLVADSHGNPEIDANGHLKTKPYDFGAASAIPALYQASLAATASSTPLSGFQIGGPGQFNISAKSIELGNSQGILSWGIAAGESSEARSYDSLAGAITPVGASVKVDVTGDLSMFTSTIASIYGGDVNVHAGGKIDLSLGDLAFSPSGSGYICFGIYTAGRSDVKVTANGDINIRNSRIGAFNGGSVSVRSEDGNVNAGNGANDALYVPVVYRDSTGALISGQIGDPSNLVSLRENPTPYGSGILSMLPTAKYQAPGGKPQPGDITVETPHGDIVSTLGGISQLALNGSIGGDPTVTLSAGTAAAGGLPAIHGNILLGLGGVIGGTVNATAEGNIQGLIISRQNANITAAQSFNGTVFSAGVANVTAGGTVSGTLVGIGGVNASGAEGVSATLVSQNVSVGGQQAESTLGTSATASSSSQSAAQQASSDTKEKIAANTKTDDEDDQKKKRAQPSLTRRVGRVTVILPKA